MPSEIDPKELLSRNPQISRDKLEESREMLSRLRESGVRRKGYDLAPAFGGRRVSVQEDEKADRIVSLRRNDECE